MNASFFRRGLSFFIDAVIYVSLAIWVFMLIAAPIYRNTITNFEHHMSVFEEVQGLVNAELEPYIEQYNNGEITLEEYRVHEGRILDSYYENPLYTESIDVGMQYETFSLNTPVILFLFNNVLAMIIFKGQSIGRRLMKLKLVGEINWLTLILREFLWKYFFWLVTLGMGLVLDVMMIFLSTNRLALRDRLTKTRIVLDDITYPF